MSNQAAVEYTIIHHQRTVARELGSLARERERQVPTDLDPVRRSENLRTSVEAVRAEIETARMVLEATYLTQVETWVADTENKLTELALLAEAVELFRTEVEVEGYGAIRFADALEGAARNLESDPEHATWAWDAVRQLLPRFQDPRLAAIEEVAVVLARYREVADKVEAALPVRLARQRAAPLLDAAREELRQLERATDRADEDLVMRTRARLRAALARLPEPSELPEAAELWASANALFTRSEEELGGHILLKEIEGVERVIEPLAERVERGLALGSKAQVIEHAPRLRAQFPALAPFRMHPRAQRLEARVRAALDRIGAELGADCAREIEASDAVPQFAIDPAAGTRIEAVVMRLNEALANYRASHLETQARFEADVDVTNGTPEAATRHVASDVEQTVGELVRGARRAEEIAAELAELDASHPALAEVATIVPVLIRRAQRWKARLGTLMEYANAIDLVRDSVERAREVTAAGAPDSPHQAISVWPELLGSLQLTDGELETASAILPDEPERAIPWRRAIAALRDHAIEQLCSVCVAEASRLATAGDPDEAQQYVDALAQAAPDAPANAQLAAMLAGSADARERAALEIEAHGALIRRCAERCAREARPAFDAWVAERPPLVTLAGTIVANLDAHRGRFIAGRCSHLGLSLADEPDTINGDVYQIDYDPEVRRQLSEGMQRLDGEFASRAEQTAAAAGVSGLPMTTQHYPRDAHYHAEIVGLAQYTPRHEVRDADGRLLGTIEGVAYAVPRIVIRAVATTYFVVTPGEPPCLEALTFDDAY